MGAGVGGGAPTPGSPLETPADCTAARPTWIGGEIFGHPDNRSINALIGVDHVDPATNKKIDRDGVACDSGGKCCANGGYSWCFHVNPSLAADGSTDMTLERQWGACVTAKVKEAYFEIYPKDATGKTSRVRYGEAVHQHQPITAGQANTVNLRLPVTYEADNAIGNTGSVQGYITCNGNPVPVSAVTRIRAWSDDNGPACGVQGFSASATQLGIGGSGQTFYRIDGLAAGQCNAPSQPYRLYMDVKCNGVTNTLEKKIPITKAGVVPLGWAY